MEALILGIVIFAAIVLFFFKVSRYAHWRPGLRKESGDGFGNHAEQRFLEEDHPVTMSMGNAGAQIANTREGREKNLGYWG